MTTEIERLLSHPNLINNKNREKFYAQRSWHPLVQFKFEAETVVEPAENGIGKIHFPNGHVQEFQTDYRRIE